MGLPTEAIFLEMNHDAMVRLGLPLEQALSAISSQTGVASDASLILNNRRTDLKLQGDFSSVAALEQLKIGKPGTTEIIALKEIATITRGPVEQPYEIIRFNGESAFTVGLSVEPGENVVAVGERVDRGIQVSSIPSLWGSNSGRFIANTKSLMPQSARFYETCL